MLEQEIAVVNRLGLHARAAAKLVQLLASYKSNAVLVCRGREINAKSIMGVMLLAAAQGSTVVMRLDGPDEAEAMQAAVDLFARYFDEGS
jgi:phosphocarrier protein HPr